MYSYNVPPKALVMLYLSLIHIFINYENHGGYDPMEIFNNDQDVRKVLMQLINGTFAPGDPELFRPCLLYTSRCV